MGDSSEFFKKALRIKCLQIWLLIHICMQKKTPELENNSKFLFNWRFLSYLFEHFKNPLNGL